MQRSPVKPTVLEEVLSRGINRTIKERNRSHALDVYLGYIIRHAARI